MDIETSDPRRRSYRQFCSAARALDVVGERWTLLIARDLLLGPRRYRDLLAGLPGITTNLLAKRLRGMTAAGLLQPSPAGYALTARGQALEPILLALGRWGRALMDRPRRGDVQDPGWALLSLKNRYRGGLELELELRIDGRAFELLCRRDGLRIQERAATHPAAIASCSLATFRQLFHGGGAATAGLVEIEGGPAAFQAFVAATA